MEILTYIELLFILLVGHAICDYALQNDFMAQAKNHTTALGKIYWPYVLTSHGLIHGGWVYIITGSFILGLAETVVHCITDYLKCAGKIGFHTDQWIHIGCKVLWVVLLAYNFEFLQQVVE